MTLDRVRRAIRRLLERIHGRYLRFLLRRGYRTYGRQGPPKPDAPAGPSGIGVQGKGHFTIAAVVTRADGRVEDRGVIAEGDTDGNRTHE